MHNPNAITIGITGASGMPYTLRLLECLLGAGETVYLLISKAAHVVFAMETDVKLPGTQPEKLQAFFADYYQVAPEKIQVFGEQQWTAPIASGSGVSRAMVVCPCTMGCLSAMACGSSDNLLERAADVFLKERKPLIVVPREMPFSNIHLQNMLTLSQSGAVMLPPNPGFYHNPKTIDDLVDFVVARILDHLEVKHNLLPVWGEQK